MSFLYRVSFSCIRSPNYIIRGLSFTSTSKQIRHRWAEKDSLPRNPNKSGPLTDLPDYTYMDGRVTPLGANQKKKLLQQRELAAKIVAMTNEMNFAIKRYNKLQDEKQIEREKVLGSKLKPKGHLLLQK